jgi:hypothetical protein
MAKARKKSSPKSKDKPPVCPDRAEVERELKRLKRAFGVVFTLNMAMEDWKDLGEDAHDAFREIKREPMGPVYFIRSSLLETNCTTDDGDEERDDASVDESDESGKSRGFIEYHGLVIGSRKRMDQASAEQYALAFAYNDIFRNVWRPVKLPRIKKRW